MAEPPPDPVLIAVTCPLALTVTVALVYTPGVNPATSWSLADVIALSEMVNGDVLAPVPVTGVCTDGTMTLFIVIGITYFVLKSINCITAGHRTKRCITAGHRSERNHAANDQRTGYQLRSKCVDLHLHYDCILVVVG